ncbi:DUF4271 domain-containing protein [Panacibacter sp. DH6]|uniref:DUF4271 domain-containing protein n=1 Tax=Panacibacter microcysteis TaxID=2793269 RepID=A0A931GXK5_9BACT|nr:DUF4271 domain-containing protein [Panacibacter microcysteis]MBG9375959.1 DUF4271 domain-containing protein [Panacibacter microcysteis]
MKPILTIFFLIFFFCGFSQDDSMLQRLLDSARTATSAAQKALAPKRDTLKARRVARKDSATLPVIINDSLRMDSLRLISADTNLLVPDSVATVSAIIRLPIPWLQDTAFRSLLKIPFIPKKIKPATYEGTLRNVTPKDFLFYALVGLVLLTAIIKQLFPKYFSSIFGLLFQASFRQKQKREQLMQETLPSLLLNILFILGGGLFAALLADYYDRLPIDFWWLVLYSVTILALVYMFKYGVIQFTGWVFNAKDAASTYSFIVFLINKIVGVILIPVVALLAFSTGQMWDVILTIAGSVVILLLIFRYIISLRVIRGTLDINPLHFFIYLCAVEIMPMFIIYKVLLTVIRH